MANYSQPPYGQWFPPPGVPLTPPVPPPNQQSGPQHQFPPGLAGLNFQAYNQNMQQTHYSPWPAPPPPQLSPFTPVFPPPFPATAGFPVPPPPIPPSAIRYAAPPAPSAPAHQTAASPPEAHVREPQSTMNGRIADTADSDKEEGELSDGDGASTETRRVLEPPRSVPESSLNSFGSTLTSQGDRAGSKAQRDYIRALPDLRAKREAAKEFVTTLQQNRIGYPNLANENLDVELLRQLYEDLGFPAEGETALPEDATVNSPSAPNLSSEPGSGPVPPVANEQGHDQRVKPVPAITTNGPQILPVKSTKSPADRQEYIARLQALKSSKQPNASKADSSHPSPAPADAQAGSSRPPASKTNEDTTSATGIPPPPSANAQLQPQVSKAVNRVAGTSTPKSEAERARQTELIKQRLEMMRAQGKLPPSNPSTPQVADTTRPTVLANPVSTVPAASIPTMSRDSSSASAATLPGLFMNSPSFPKAGQPPRPAQAAAASGTTFTTRKRPVASDFDDDHGSRPQAGPRYTRPLGQSPHEHHRESMVISISDDESDGSDMDLDEDHTGTHAAPQPIPSRATGNGTRSAITNRSSSGKQSAVPTPPPSRTPAEATSEELLKREQAILKLKAKIAALSSKQKLTQANRDAISSSSAAESSTIVQSSNQDGHASVRHAPQLVNVPTATATHHAVVPPAVTIGVNITTNKSTTWMKQRRMEIQSALRALDSDLENDNARLARLEKEIAEIRAKRDKEKRDREKLVEELESFGIDTEGMGDEELLARKEEMDHDKKVQSASQAGPSALLKEAVQPVTKVRASSEMQGSSPQQPEVIHPPEVPVFSTISTGDNVSGSPPPQVEPRIEEDIVMDDAETATGPPQVREAATPQVRVSEGPVASFAEQVTTEQVESATSVDDEDFYSPEPTVRPMVIPAISTQQDLPDSHASVRPPSEEGEMEMSEEPEAGEEEYNPEAPMATELVAISEQEVSKSSGAASVEEDEGEIYEPEELPATAEISPTFQVDGPRPGEIQTAVQAGIAQETQESLPPTDASQITGQENETDYQDEMDLSTSSDESDAVQTPPEKAHRGSISHTHWNGSDVAVADDLAPELQPQGLPALVPVPEPAFSSATVPDKFGFTPYESPLRMFKSYRYHPNYSQHVAGGFLSLTYSHQIDPEKPLCRFEAVGGTCNDPHCDGQHFRDMKISGDKLLVQLGTANPGKTPEERQRWNDGLKLVLQELRRKSIKDPNGIAVEIANYRRQFLKDDTRVVNL